MNGDLISRKYVVRELLKEREHYPPMVAERYSLGVKLPHHFNQAMRGGIRKALRIAETAPAVDAEPVKHGRCALCRIKETGHGIIAYYGIGWQVCITKRDNSYCMVVNHEGCQTYIPIAYCPACGTKMRGDNDAAD